VVQSYQLPCGPVLPVTYHLPCGSSPHISYLVVPVLDGLMGPVHMMVLVWCESHTYPILTFLDLKSLTCAKKRMYRVAGDLSDFDGRSIMSFQLIHYIQ